MSGRLPAIWALFLCAGSAIALAQDSAPRQVAVVDLSEDAKVREKSVEIYAAITSTEGLAPPAKRNLDSSLTGTFYDEDASDLAGGHASLSTAESLRQVKLDYAGAEAEARKGLGWVANVAPNLESRALYADLALVAALSLLDQKKPNDARSLFALVHRLDPSRELDPGRYSPDVLTAYKRAVDAKPELVTVEVKGSGHVWIDFVDRGPAPGAYADIELGEHVVTLAGPERQTLGQPVPVTGPVTVSIVDGILGEDNLVKRARLALSRAQAKHDDIGRANAMNQLAKVLGVGDVVMISKRPDGKLQWETWRDRAPGFSPPREYTATTKPEELLEGIAPPPKPRPDTKQPSGPKVFKIPPPEVPWYEERWLQASAAATVAVAIVGGILWVRRTQDVGINNDIKGM